MLGLLKYSNDLQSLKMMGNTCSFLMTNEFIIVGFYPFGSVVFILYINLYYYTVGSKCLFPTMLTPIVYIKAYTCK